jgi:SAM-dependent methyltransferase
MIGGVLRASRTAALWLAGPADRLWLLATGRGQLPPLWLRRHTGPLRGFERSAQAMAAWLDELGLLADPGLVLDAGCGAGAMVPELAHRLGPNGRYVGFDVHAPSIRWCRRRWAADPRLRFEIAEAASAYGSSRTAAGDYRFPVDDGAAGLILAKSLFTHLLRDDAAHYLRETRRALSPGKPAVVTAFLFDDAGPAPDSVRREFPFSQDAGGRIRFRSRLRPTAAVAYAKSEFFALVEQAGLRVQWLRPGFFPGSSPVTGQDTLLLGH